MKPRLLLIELHHLGDAVMSLPFVRGTQKKFDLHILCRPSTTPVYRLLAEPPQLHEWEPPWADDQPCRAVNALRAAQEAGQSLRTFRLETSVCVWADARVGVLMTASGAARRIGFPMTRRNYYAAHLPWRAKRRVAGRTLELARQILARPLLTTPLHRENNRQHHLRCWEQIAETLGVACDHSTPWIPIQPSLHAQQLRNTALANGKKLLVLHADARRPSKQWPIERWRALCALPSIRERFELCQIQPPGGEATGLDIPALETPDVSSLAAALAAADTLVCHDSLPAHLGAALGKSVVTIFGSGEPDWFAPWNNRSHAIQRRVCPLHPCIDRCGMDSFLCLDAIRVEDVAMEIMKLAAVP